MKAVYGIDPGEVWWTASDVGWVVGHSYIVYGPLLAGCTTVLYEGKPVGTPDAGAFWRVIAEHGVRVLFTAPTAFRAIRKEDPTGEHPAKHDLSTLRALFLAGERLDPETYRWAARPARHPGRRPLVADRDRLAGRRQPARAGGAAGQGRARRPCRCPGWDVRVLDPAGAPVPPDVDGALVMKLPLPPGALPTLWRDDERYVSSYLSRYPGFYLTGDGGHVDADGYLFVMGRIDDVINVAGHRLSTGAMEEVLAGHPAVAECAVIGVADALKGQVPRGFVVLKAGVDDRRRRWSPASWCSGCGRDRRGRVAAPGRRGRGAAEDPVGQDPARDDAGDRRRRRAAGAVHDRGPGGAGRAPPDPEVLAVARRGAPIPSQTANRATAA